MKCATHLIDDTPHPEDQLAFHGRGAHDRVARALADLIQSSSHGGKLIGVEGKWGSGKSTVIGLMRRRLDSTPGTRTFVFDAWAHERDPLRRSFLESLIRCFQSVGWVSGEKWNTELDKLSKRRKVTTTRTTPHTTTLGKCLVAAALLVPFGTALVEGAFERGVTLDLLSPVNWSFVIGAVLSLSPVVVLLGNLIRIRRNRWKEEPQHGATPVERSASEWALLTGNATSESIQDTTETPEPTSIEFEEVFRRLMNSALSGPDARRVVLVLDNLDRVDPADALGMWSTLQTFLQDRSAETELWFSRIWVVVPYDKSGLSRLWQSRGAAGSPPLEGVAESFIDKSFQIRFEVPPPVLSNWRLYLLKLLGEALPQHADDAHHVYRAYNHEIVKRRGPPTPRELKLYVNQVGALHRQWEHQFPLSHLAYYATLQRKFETNEDIRKALISGDAPDSPIVSELPADLRSNLAGLLFNVEASVGEQLLLTDPILRAFEEADGSRLRELQETHKAGFWVVLEDVIASNIGTSDADTMCSTARCLNESGLLRDRTQPDVAVVTRAVAAALSGVKTWHPVTDQTIGGISAACSMVADPQFSKTAVDTLRSTLEGVSDEDAGRLPSTEMLIQQIASLMNEVKAMRHTEAITAPFMIHTDTDEWVDSSDRIVKQDRWLWALFRPRVPLDRVVDRLAETIQEGEISEAGLSAMEVTHSSGEVESWEAVVDAVEGRLDATNTVGATEGVLLLRALHLLERYQPDEAREAAERLCDPGHLLSLLHQAQQEDHLECKVWCIVSFLRYRPDAAEPSGIQWSVTGHGELTAMLEAADVALAEGVVQVLSARKEWTTLFSVADARSQYDELVLECLRNVAGSSDYLLVYTPAEVVDRWKDLRSYLPDEREVDRFSKLVDRLVTDTDLVQRLAGSPFQVDDAGLYLAVLKTHPGTEFAAFCKKGIETLGRDEWESALQDNGEVLTLLTTLQKNDVPISLKQPYQDAIVEYAKAVLDGQSQPSKEVIEERSLVVSPLSRGPRQVLRNRLRDAAIERDGDCADAFFALFGDEIAKSRLTSGKDIIVKLFSGLVRRRGVGGLEWLHSVLQAQPSLLGKFRDKAAVADFRERIQGEISRHGEEADEAAHLIQGIADVLEIQPLRADPSSTGECASADSQ